MLEGEKREERETVNRCSAPVERTVRERLPQLPRLLLLLLSLSPDDFSLSRSVSPSLSCSQRSQLQRQATAGESAQTAIVRLPLYSWQTGGEDGRADGEGGESEREAESQEESLIQRRLQPLPPKSGSRGGKPGKRQESLITTRDTRVILHSSEGGKEGKREERER